MYAKYFLRRNLICKTLNNSWVASDKFYNSCEIILQFIGLRIYKQANDSMFYFHQWQYSFRSVLWKAYINLQTISLENVLKFFLPFRFVQKIVLWTQLPSLSRNIIHVYHWSFQTVFSQLRNQNTELKIPYRK